MDNSKYVKIVKSSQMKNLDKAVISQGYIPSILLMERAGVAITNAILSRYHIKTALIMCGSGNNGGDGYVVARLLMESGVKVTVLKVMEPASADCITMAKMYEMQDCGNLISDYKNEENFDIYIDAILGTGVDRPLSADLCKLMQQINNKQGIKVAIDNPTGVDSDSGEIMGVGFVADFTAVLALPKMATFNLISYNNFGKSEILDIGMPKKVIEQIDTNVFLVDELCQPKRPKNGNKGTFGNVFVVAGSATMSGAAQLCCMAALRSGCGIVRLAVPKKLLSVMSSKLTEVITLPLETEEFAEDYLEEYHDILQKASAVIYGCGVGCSEENMVILAKIMTTYCGTLIIDADGINMLGSMMEVLHRKTCNIIITPHIGEFARLIGESIEYVNKNFYAVAKKLAVEYNITVVLKSAYTITAKADGSIYVNAHGNEGMATAGSGDVLAGIIGGFVAQNIPPEYGVYAHAVAGDFAYEEKSFSMIATDIINNLHKSFKRDD